MTSETVNYTAAKLSGLRRRAMPNWMAGAVKPSHRGVFRRKAQAAGMSTAAYARKEAGAPGKLGREARLAETFAKFRPKRKARKVVDHLTAMRARGAFAKARG